MSLHFGQNTKSLRLTVEIRIYVFLLFIYDVQFWFWFLDISLYRLTKLTILCNNVIFNLFDYQFIRFYKKECWVVSIIVTFYPTLLQANNRKKFLKVTLHKLGILWSKLYDLFLSNPLIDFLYLCCGLKFLEVK